MRLEGGAFPDPDDVAAAIARVEESRQTHVLWLDYWHDLARHRASCPLRTGCPWEDRVASDTAIAGDMAHQEDAIAGYDHVLDVLRSLV